MSAAGVIAAHADYVSDFARHCTCGEWSDVSPEAQRTRLPFTQHVLSALKAAGYAVVELPTAEEVEDYGLYVSRAPHFGLPVGEEHDQGSRFRSIDETRRYAAALLAVAEAADAAEDTP